MQEFKNQLEGEEETPAEGGEGTPDQETPAEDAPDEEAPQG